MIVYGGTFSRRFDVELANLLKKTKSASKLVVLDDYSGWQRTFPLEEKPPKEGAGIHLGLAGLLNGCRFPFLCFFLIPPIRRSPYLSVVCRLLLGAIFISFALSKILRPASLP